jgi:hypothetical protein
MEARAPWERVETNVEWIERRAYELASAETDRTRALDGKASQVLAVAAVATSIAASALVPRLEDAPPAAAWIAAGAGAAVIAAAAAAVCALFPRAFLSFTGEEIGDWPTGDFLSQRPRDVHGRILNGWLEVVLRARRINSLKSHLVRAALASLGLALILTTVAAGTMASVGRKDPKDPKSPSPTNQGLAPNQAVPTGQLFPKPGLGPNTAGRNPDGSHRSGSRRDS